MNRHLTPSFSCSFRKFRVKTNEQNINICFSFVKYSAAAASSYSCLQQILSLSFGIVRRSVKVNYRNCETYVTTLGLRAPSLSLVVATPIPLTAQTITNYSNNNGTTIRKVIREFMLYHEQVYKWNILT